MMKITAGGRLLALEPLSWNMKSLRNRSRFRFTGILIVLMFVTLNKEFLKDRASVLHHTPSDREAR